MSAEAGQTLTTTCCIAGGGPAGMMLGFLLARAGVPVVVLEKHKDFLRDFRGDTVHPSTLEIIYELGLLPAFLARPHQEARRISGVIGGRTVHIADFTHLPTHCRFIALMPQWDFLDFLADHARAYAAFQLRQEAEVVGLLEEHGQIVGVRARTPEGPLLIHAALVVGADGRHSTVREHAHLDVQDLGAPIDVLWLRLPRGSDDGDAPIGRIAAGRILVMIDRGAYWQCAYVIRKGGASEVKARGLDAFRDAIVEVAPLLRDRVHTLRDWDDVKLLTVAVDRLRRWYRPGVLCIGDAAHAMSPVGGVGINLAIQDAVAAANRLARPLANGTLTEAELAAVQHRRLWPTRVTQAAQVLVQNQILRRVLTTRRALTAPWPVRLLDRWPSLQRIPARLVGLGVRPEHVRTPDAGRSRK